MKVRKSDSSPHPQKFTFMKKALPAIVLLCFFLLPSGVQAQAFEERPMPGYIGDRYFFAGPAFAQEPGSIRYTNLMLLHNQLSYGVNPHLQLVGSFTLFSVLPRFFREQRYSNPLSVGVQLSAPGLPDWVHLSFSPELTALTGSDFSVTDYRESWFLTLSGKLTVGSANHHVTLGLTRFFGDEFVDYSVRESFILIAGSSRLARNVHLIAETRFDTTAGSDDITLLGFRYFISGPFSFTNGLAWAEPSQELMPFFGLHLKF